MTNKEELELKWENLIKHNPIRYVVKKKVITYAIEDIHGNLVELFLKESNAKIKCEMLNSIYSLGYSVGVEAAVKTLTQ